MIKCLFVAALFLAAFSARAENLSLDIGQILVLSPEAPVAAVVVGNPKVLDVAVEGEKSVLVFGKASGSSDMVMLNAAHEVVYSARFTVAGPAEPKPPAAPPPVAARRPPADRATVTVRGPAEKGMAEVRWVCGTEGRCTTGSAP